MRKRLSEAWAGRHEPERISAAKHRLDIMSGMPLKVREVIRLLEKNGSFGQPEIIGYSEAPMAGLPSYRAEQGTMSAQVYIVPS